MSVLFKNMPDNYQELVLEKWAPILDAGDKIVNEQTRLSTAIVLENSQKMLEEGSGAFGVGSGGSLGTFTTPGATADARMPFVVIPTARRIFPNLIAHDVVGVQPMNGPLGFAFALRFKNAANGKGTQPADTELGYNYLDSAFTGASGLAITGSNAYWEAFAGTGSANAYGVNTYGSDGQGATLEDSEFWGVNSDMPMAKFSLEKSTVTSKSRKLATNYSLETAEDMAMTQGLDAEAEMINLMSYEVKQEIDRQLLGEMVKAAVNGGKYSTWSPVSADGRHQLERISTLVTWVTAKSNDIAIATRRGPATFAISSPTVCALLQRFMNYQLDQTATGAVEGTGQLGVSKVGILPGANVSLYRDTFAGGDYVLLGYKGPTPYDAGIIYCPHIPLQLMKVTNQTNFSPSIGVRTRYGILANLFGAENYYHFIKVSDLTNVALAADGGRLFL